MADRKESVKTLASNSDEEFLSASEILLKFANNVLNNPNDSKYRRIRLGNPIVRTKLLDISGAMECLFDMGFDESQDEEVLMLPMDNSLVDLEKIRNDLNKEMWKRGMPPPLQPGEPNKKNEENTQPSVREAQPSNSATQSTGSVSQSGLPVQSGNEAVGSRTVPIQSAPATVPINLVSLKNEMQFFTKLRSSFDHVLVYEDVEIQQKARATIPVEELNKEAADRHQQALGEATANTDNGLLDRRDFLLLALLNWFKCSFFSWVNAPRCQRCGAETKTVGMTEALPAELRWGANRVENYQCNKCSSYTRFPRYNHPGKLLETRKGRCGEWANCFTLCCRAVGFEARYILDWTDHVWTEVFSESQNRWLHCDPCENVCDKPLLYEAGWGKKLTYVMAFSKDDLQDVTWRYSANHGELMWRRNECSEKSLVSAIIQLRDRRQSALSEERRKVLLDRCVRELADLLTPPKTGEDPQLSGRISGSLAWRAARGETGKTAVATEPYVFKLSSTERASKLFHMKYCCASDKYVIVSCDDKEMKMWNKCVFSTKSVFRKEEHDWKMAYLARTEGSPTAEISWKFDFSGLKVEKVKIYVGSATYENGMISWRLCADDQSCVRLQASELNIVEELKGCGSLTLTAVMSGGKGGVAWQHTQLFRQGTQETETFPLDIQVYLTD